jgi:hypothetical protein
MKKTPKSAKPVSVDAIARLADQGKDISRFFKGQGRMVQPIQRVNVDVTASMLEELDQAAQDLNVSRQAVIKTLVRQALDQHYLAQRKATSVRCEFEGTAVMPSFSLPVPGPSHAPDRCCARWTVCW